MESRPKIKLVLTKTDMLFEVSGWIGLIIIWILTLKNYSKLPDIIPVHYNFAGHADSFGGKESVFLLPSVATVMYLGLTILNSFPHVFNYPRLITLENASKQYTIATRLIRYLKCIIVVVLGFIHFNIMYTSYGSNSRLGSWFLPLTILLIFVPIIISLRYSFKD